MRIDAEIATEVCAHEGIVREAYKDSVGVWTWSVGLTNNSGHNVTRYIDNPQSMQRCLEVFLWALERYADDVRKAFKGHKLTKAQFTAALSFHWNTGAIKSASWVKSWKKGKISTARAEFMKWNKPREIIDRRAAERDLFFDGRWSGDGKINEYKIHKRSHTPDWGSRKRVPITATLDAILRGGPPDVPPEDMVEANPAPLPPDAPAIEPSPKPQTGLFSLVLKLLLGAFSRGK